MWHFQRNFEGMLCGWNNFPSAYIIKVSIAISSTFNEGTVALRRSLLTSDPFGIITVRHACVLDTPGSRNIRWFLLKFLEK